VPSDVARHVHGLFFPLGVAAPLAPAVYAAVPGV
jgi:hypothetical protein